MPKNLRSSSTPVARIVRPLRVFFSSVKAGRGSSRDADGRLFTYYGQNEWRVRLEKAGFAVLHLRITGQDPTRRDSDKWISCVARRNGSVEGEFE